MSIQILTTDEGRSRPSFVCDLCSRPVQPEEGLLFWNPAQAGVQNTLLLCRDCDTGEQLSSQELDTGLVYLLVCAGWFDDHFKLSAKAQNAIRSAQLLASL